MNRWAHITAEQRFWKKVQKSTDPDACWPWTGKTVKGYGRFTYDGEIISVPRFSYELHKGPLGDLQACHSCDNPPCANPNHLFAGTNHDNVMDMVQKGRTACGDRNGARLHPERLRRGANHGLRLHPESVKRGEQLTQTKLTEALVREIRATYVGRGAGPSYDALARRFNVTTSNIAMIVKGKTWTHL